MNEERGNATRGYICEGLCNWSSIKSDLRENRQEEIIMEITQENFSELNLGLLTAKVC